MLEIGVVDTAIVIVLATIWGVMVCFAFIVTPVVFKALERPQASVLLARLIPVYYLTLGALSWLGWLLMFAVPTASGAQSITAMIAAGFLVGYRFLVPALERARDARSIGDPAGERRFKYWHSIGVALNLAQMMAVLVVMVRETQRF